MLRLHLPGLAGLVLGGIVWTIALERGRRWARRALPAMALLGMAQLILVNYGANPTVPKSFYTYQPPVLEHLQGLNGSYRVYYLYGALGRQAISDAAQTFMNFDSIPEATGIPPLAHRAFQDRLLLARGSMLSKVEVASNNDVELSFPTFLQEFWIFTLRHMRVAARTDYLLGRTNVKYEIVRNRRDSPETRQTARIFNGSSEPSYLYENLRAVPRAYVVGRALFSDNSSDTLVRLSAPDFAAVEEVILAASPGSAPHVEGPGAAGQVETVDRQPNTVTLRAELTRPGYVVLLDRYDPNWHATLDGREVPVLRANQLFRAVCANAGKHAIRFYYRQAGLRAGMLISLATLALLAAIYVLNPRFPFTTARPASAGTSSSGTSS